MFKKYHQKLLRKVWIYSDDMILILILDEFNNDKPDGQGTEQRKIGKN